MYILVSFPPSTHTHEACPICLPVCLLSSVPPPILSSPPPPNKTPLCAHPDLWICLICGHVGCGRYRGSHAADHWQSSGHGYALELETQVNGRRLGGRTGTAACAWFGGSGRRACAGAGAGAGDAGEHCFSPTHTHLVPFPQPCAHSACGTTSTTRTCTA